MVTTTYHSPLGDITLAADERGLRGLWFADQAHFGSTLEDDAVAFDMHTGEFEQDLEADPAASGVLELEGSVEEIEGSDALSGAMGMASASARNAAAVGVLERAWAWLNAYFAGQAPRWTPPLHFEGTEFQHAVWVQLLSIPYGETVTYGELARRIAERQNAQIAPSPRAVGVAVGRNPVSIIVPCHRVVGADGSLTGYAGGIERKRRLLELEAANRTA